MTLEERMKKLSIRNDILIGLRKNKATHSDKQNDCRKWLCTDMQREFWHHWKMFPDDISNNISGYVKAVDFDKIDAAKEAFFNMVRSYDILRTKFVYEDDTVFAEIEDYDDADFQLIDMRGKDEDAIIEKMREESKIPFDLGKGKLIRFRIIDAGNNVCYMLMIQHHIISDGTTSGVIINELFSRIDGYENPNKNAAKNFYKYLDSNHVSKSKYDKELDYWNENMKDNDMTLHLPASQLVEESDSGAGSRLEFEIPAELVTDIKKIASRLKVTPFSIYMSALRILLYRYSKQDDAVIVIPVQGRNYVGSENMIGCFLNMLPIRNKIDKDMSIDECIVSESDRILQAMDNQDVSFSSILKNLDIKSESLNSAVYHIVFSYEGDPTKLLSDDKYSFDELFLGVTKSDLVLELNQDGDKIHGWFEYRTALFSELQMKLFLKSFMKVLTEINEEKHNICDIDGLTDDDKNIVLSYGNGKKTNEKHETISERFIRIVKKFPERVAVSDSTKNLTYSQLYAQSCSLAKKLIENGIGKENIVAIIMDRTADFVISVFAVFLAGAAYLPVEPTYPEKRIKFMLDDSGAKAVITNLQNNELFENVRVIPFEVDESFNADGFEEAHVSINDLAYIIYTSGTTGTPKGVMVEHKGVSNLADYFKEEYEISSTDNVLQFAHVIFDAYVWEVAVTLLNGAGLHIAEQNVLLDSKKISEFIRERSITVVAVPPQYWKQICREDIKIRFLLTAGSEADKEVIKYTDKVDVYVNGYGPTENTVCISTWSRRNGDKIPRKIPIGKPMRNADVCIFDGEKLCGVGMLGEICVSGIGVARGYLNREEMTSQKFTLNPFTGEKMYHTGDYGYWLDSGYIAFSGRIDDQVKVRGYRIETGEIEKTLISIDQIKSCAVKTIKDENNNNILVAYIVADEDITVKQINEWLNSRLQFYMIPSLYYQLDELPVTINGKIDYKKLDGLGKLMVTETAYAAPETEMEKTICSIWEEVLGREHIGIYDAFFECGGDSLMIIKIIEKAREQDVQLEIRSFYEDKTIRKIAQNAVIITDSNDDDKENVSESIDENDLEVVMGQFNF